MEVYLIIIAIIILTFLLLFTVVFLISYSGLLEEVFVGAGKPPVRNLKVAYKFGKGSLNGTGDYFTEVTSIAPDKRCFAVYYDDSEQVPPDRLRWAVGCILAEGDELAEPTISQTLKTKGYKFCHFPDVTNVVKTSFPYKTQFSVMIGTYKVYPLLKEYIKINKLCAHPYIEIYEDDHIHFLAPLAKQSEFYVPEAGGEIQEERDFAAIVSSTRGEGDSRKMDKVNQTQQSPDQSNNQVVTRMGDGPAITQKSQDTVKLGSSHSSQVKKNQVEKVPESSYAKTQVELKGKGQNASHTLSTEPAFHLSLDTDLWNSIQGKPDDSHSQHAAVNPDGVGVSKLVEKMLSQSGTDATVSDDLEIQDDWISSTTPQSSFTDDSCNEDRSTVSNSCSTSLPPSTLEGTSPNTLIVEFSSDSENESTQIIHEKKNI